MNTSQKTRRNWFRVGALAVSLLVVGSMIGASNAASAAPIGPGFDYFTTFPGGAAVDLGFGPILLTGVPLPSFALGVTDTVVARMDPGPPEGGLGLIDIELVALHLVSVAPVDFDPGPGVMLGDLHITIDASDRFFTGLTPVPDGSGAGPSLFGLPTVPNTPSIGSMEMIHGGPGPHLGATMRACFGDPVGCAGTVSGVGLGVPGGGIFASAFAVIPGGSLFDPLDVFASMPAPSVILASTGAYLHMTSDFAEFGGLRLGSVLHEGPHPGAQPNEDEIVPEPSSALLALAGLIGCGLAGNTRRRRT